MNDNDSLALSTPRSSLGGLPQRLVQDGVVDESGMHAALHAAAALASRGPIEHCGLATLGLFAGLEDPLPARGGTITLPTAPGLGVEPF